MISMMVMPVPFIIIKAILSYVCNAEMQKCTLVTMINKDFFVAFPFYLDQDDVILKKKKDSPLREVFKNKTK